MQSLLFLVQVPPSSRGCRGSSSWCWLDWSSGWCGLSWPWGGADGVPSVDIGVQASGADVSRGDGGQPGEDIEEGLSDEGLRSTEDVGEESDKWIDQVVGDLGVPNGAGEGDQGIDGTVHVHGHTDLSLADESHGLNELGGSVQEDKSGNVGTDGADVEAVLDEATDDCGSGTGNVGSGDGAGIGHTVEGIEQVVPDGFLDWSLVQLTDGADCLLQTLVGGEEEGFIPSIEDGCRYGSNCHDPQNQNLV